MNDATNPAWPVPHEPGCSVSSPAARVSDRSSRRSGSFLPTGAPLLWLLGGVLTIFVGAPIFALIANQAGNQIWPVLSNPQTSAAVATSLVATTISTLLVTVLGVPLAYLLARVWFPGRALVGGLIYLPLVLPPVVAGIMLLLVWGQAGTFGQFLEPHGIYFVGEISGIILAQMFVSAPFVVVASRSAFERVDRDLVEAARIAGADSMQIFWAIAVPLSLRAIMAGAALSWMRAFGEFGATVIMAYHPYSFSVLTYVQFGSYGLAPVLPMALLAVALGAAALAVAALIERIGLVRRLRIGLLSPAD